MAQKKHSHQTKLITETTLKLAAKSGWGGVTLPDVSRKSGISLPTLKKEFSDVWDILILILREIEKETEKTVKGHLGDLPRDNLIEILMTRFDIAGKNAAAFSRLAEEMPRHPAGWKRLAPVFYATMKRLLALAGYTKPSPLFTAAFGACYFSIVRAWIDDDTRDKSKTLATIDKRIDTLEKSAGFLNCGKGR